MQVVEMNVETRMPRLRAQGDTHHWKSFRLPFLFQAVVLPNTQTPLYADFFDWREL